ncbi:hypothetical protein PoB_004812400 [Plakobranchus ocellatus]|uniref:Uncharacterized protein n=1 Tax=Plakobranchus ocellatus TaxID=259542 RepID=A0AAV4BND7_9GAST|nr:hypothetical protein PoB_004812400 [Plakobranchus ocellatus]
MEGSLALLDVPEYGKIHFNYNVSFDHGFAAMLVTSEQREGARNFASAYLLAADTLPSGSGSQIGGRQNSKISVRGFWWKLRLYFENNGIIFQRIHKNREGLVVDEFSITVAPLCRLTYKYDDDIDDNEDDDDDDAVGGHATTATFLILPRAAPSTPEQRLKAPSPPPPLPPLPPPAPLPPLSPQQRRHLSSSSSA